MDAVTMNQMKYARNTTCRTTNATNSFPLKERKRLGFATSLGGSTTGAGLAFDLGVSSFMRSNILLIKL